MLGFFLNKHFEQAIAVANDGEDEYITTSHVVYAIFKYNKPFHGLIVKTVPDINYLNILDNLGGLLDMMPKSNGKSPIQTYEFKEILAEFSSAKEPRNELDFILKILRDKENDCTKILNHYGINDTVFELIVGRYKPAFDRRDEYVARDEEAAIRLNSYDIDEIAHAINYNDKQKEWQNTEFEPTFENERLAINERDIKKDSPSSLYTLNLNKAAREGKIDPLIGREKEIEKTLQTLCRRKKNNPILVGEAGVGKTAIVEGIALKIVGGEVPQKLKNKEIYALGAGALIAGTTLRGEFEERLKDLIDEFSTNQNAILFIDEIHTIVGAGTGNRNELDMSNILKPALAGGSLSLIGATTYGEYRSFSQDKALSRRFCKIDVSEPSIDDSVEILKGIAKKYEEFHDVKFSDEILRESVTLAKKYLSDKFLPDSAIDLIDETGASFAFKSRTAPIQIGKNDLINTLSVSANIANLSQTVDNREVLKNLEANIKSEIFGQDEAVQSLCKALLRSYAGLGAETSPIGVFLFAGSSGVGKSELAKVLAKYLGVHFERYDMSEYMEAHSVSRLIGAPPGYVGFENGGILTNNIKKHPYSVILFDEIEKAHPSMTNIFLGLFDNASLTDNNGVTTDFKNTIVIMSSNLGTKEAPQVGFTKDESYKIDNAIKSFFAPEFRNRIDKIINFNRLSTEILEKIVDKTIRELEAGLKNVKFSLSKAAKDFIITRGYSDEFGARNLKREIGTQISDRISEELLFGALQNGGTVEIDSDGAELEFKFFAASKALQLSGAKSAAEEAGGESANNKALSESCGGESGTKAAVSEAKNEKSF